MFSHDGVFVEPPQLRPMVLGQLLSAQHSDFDASFYGSAPFPTDLFSSARSKTIHPVVEGLIAVIVPLKLMGLTGNHFGPFTNCFMFVLSHK